MVDGAERPDRALTDGKARVHEVIYESDTAAGKAFDLALIFAILASVAVVMLESVADVRERHGTALRAAEWTFTVLFTIEYALRLWSVGRPLRYARSFFGLVDLLAIVPTYLSVLLPGAPPADVHDNLAADLEPVLAHVGGRVA